MQKNAEIATKQGEHLANPAGKCHAHYTPLPRTAWWKTVKTRTSTARSEPSLFEAGWPRGGWGGRNNPNNPIARYPICLRQSTAPGVWASERLFTWPCQLLLFSRSSCIFSKSSIQKIFVQILVVAVVVT